MIFVDLDQRTPEWQSWRWMGITATESAVILGRSLYKTAWRLWCEKTGRALPPDLSANPQVRYGRDMESVVRRAFELRHAEVLFPQCAECSEDRVFRASFDGLTADDEPVELKCPGAETLSAVKALGRGSSWNPRKTAKNLTSRPKTALDQGREEKPKAGLFVR